VKFIIEPFEKAPKLGEFSARACPIKKCKPLILPILPPW